MKQKPTKPAKHPGGRPRKTVDEKILRNLAGIGATTEEMAAVLSVSKDTLERNYTAVISEGRAEGRATLRRRQWQAAMEGDKALLIFLGKNMLGQTDRQDFAHTGADGGPLEIIDAKDRLISKLVQSAAQTGETEEDNQTLQ